MAQSFVSGTFTGSSNIINISFGYLDKSQVAVTLDGVLTTAYTWNSDSQIQLSASAASLNGKNYLAQRTTPEGLLVDFQPGNIDADDLNFSLLQVIYVSQEARDRVAQSVSSLEGLTGRTIQTSGMSGGALAVYDAGGNIVASTVDVGGLPDLPGYVTDAEEAANQAQSFATQAMGYRGTALTASGSASDAALLASQWASNPEDIPVVTGQFSARHWAGKAQSSALMVSPVVGSVSQLKALDTTKIKAVFLSLAGRAGCFLWLTGNYSSYISGDPLEGVFIKADAIPTSSGAWVRVVSGAIDIRWFGAVPQSDPVATTTAIQRALNLAALINVGRVYVPAGEWRLSKTQTETYQTVAMPSGSQDQYALLVPTGISLEGEGYRSILKRFVATPLVVVLCANTVGSQVRNLRIEGNATSFPFVGDTYGSGAGLFVESGTGTEDRTNVLDTLWINDTPGYGIGVEWGNHRGLSLTNIFINGTGSDGIDIKRMNNGGSTFDSYAVVLDNITVENFGRTATDAALQAGIDLRGYFTASNLHVRGFGAQAQSGIRMRGGLSTDNAIGAQRSSLTNFRVERVSGGVTETYSLEINPDYVNVSNGTVEGCTDDVSFILAGNATAASCINVTNVMSFNATRNGFRVRPQFRGVTLNACVAVQTATTAGNSGFLIEGLDTKLVTPRIVALTGLPTCIRIAAGAQRTGIIQPTYIGGASATVVDGGTGTVTL